jgi:mono/diheme cytochrome c family protein
MSNRKLLAVLAAAVIAVVALPAFADSGADGAALYKSKCAMCHGPDGAGQTPMGKSMKLRDLRSAEVQKATDKELNTLISDGKGKMPAYKAKMCQAEIDAVIGFIRSIKK